MSLVYSDTANALENRRLFLQGLNINYQDLVCAQQVHGGQVRYVTESDKGKGAFSDKDSLLKTDALVTDQRNLPLAIFTADCLPIFLYDFKTPAIALVHAGWQGTRENITSKTVELMKDEFATHPQDISIGFGPAIRECCYEVGGEFNDFFSFGLRGKDQRYYLDLVGINKKQLFSLGVREANIFDSGICTCCRNQEFFSYRKEGKSSGRMISVMMLK